MGSADQETDEVFLGDLDDVRGAGSARTLEWIAAEHQSQRAGSTFVSVGTAEPSGRTAYPSVGWRFPLEGFARRDHVVSWKRFHAGVMKTISATTFKEQCLALLDEPGPEGIVITKRGKPVARLIRYELKPTALIGALRGKLHVNGDILSSGERWDAEP